MMPNGQPPSGLNLRSQPSFSDPNFFGNLDPSQAAKQMAALSAASNARMASSSGGTNLRPYLGGIGSQDPHLSGSGGSGMSQPQNPASFFDATMSAPNAAAGRPPAQSNRSRYQGFFVGLANIMMKRNTPLPPQLTGIQTPSYDPQTSQFKVLELSSELGHFRLAGRDIDVFKLWGAAVSSGGSATINWQNLANQFGLPDELPQPHGTGTTSSVRALQACYDLVLGPFEELYKRNVMEQQKKAQLSSKPPSMLQSPGTPNRPANAIGAGMPSQLPRTSGLPASNPNTSFSPSGVPQTAGHVQSSDNVLDDMQGLKRKLDLDDHDAVQKRVRQKTVSEPSDDPSVTTGKASETSVSTKRMQPVRRKIEYVPMAREVDTFGGRDLKRIEAEMFPSIGRDPPLKEMADWGSVETDALVMCIRSRISTELSYALTTLGILSTMKGPSPGSGFPIHQCGDLFDELLDLLEDLAFDGVEDKFELNPSGIEIVTHQQLMNAIHDRELSDPFGRQRKQGDADPAYGLRQRTGNTILLTLTIVRNLSAIPDNSEFIYRQLRLVDLLLRLSIINNQNGVLAPFSPVLSLSDLVTVRKDSLTIIDMMAPSIHFSNSRSPSMGTMKTAARLFQLIASYLVDPAEAISPSSYMKVMGGPPTHAPPTLSELALDTFTRLGQLDTNRQVFSKTIPPVTLILFMRSLVRRLPIIDADFQLLMKESWLSHMEKIILCVYSVAFLATPALKSKIKSDRNLGIKSLFLRIIHKLLMYPNAEARVWFVSTARRAVETLKVLDDGEDSFDNTSKAVAPTIFFGMGWGDASDGDVEQGTGLLAAHRIIAWELLMQRDVFSDEILFNELESLARVECAA